MLQLDEVCDVYGGVGGIERGNPEIDLFVGICPQLQDSAQRGNGSPCVLVSHLREWIERTISHGMACDP